MHVVPKGFRATQIKGMYFIHSEDMYFRKCIITLKEMYIKFVNDCIKGQNYSSSNYYGMVP
jgi:hypothetical protein